MEGKHENIFSSIELKNGDLLVLKFGYRVISSDGNDPHFTYIVESTAKELSACRVVYRDSSAQWNKQLGKIVNIQLAQIYAETGGC